MSKCLQFADRAPINWYRKGKCCHITSESLLLKEKKSNHFQRLYFFIVSWHVSLWFLHESSPPEFFLLHSSFYMSRQNTWMLGDLYWDFVVVAVNIVSHQIVLRLGISPRLASNSWQSSRRSLWSAGITGMLSDLAFWDPSAPCIPVLWCWSHSY